MRTLARITIALTATLALAACGSSAATQAPAGSTGGGTATVCQDSTGTTVVSASVANMTWSQPVTAKVGDVITWTNTDSVPHKVALDDGSCTMSNSITTGSPQSLVFTKAGTYAFHCSIHPTMKGTITITN